MKKCICFSRTSTIQQDVRQQTDVVFDECIKDGYSESQIIVIEEQESAIKLSIEERQGIQKLKSFIESDSEIDCVYCFEISRLSRQPKMLYEIRDYLVSRGIQLVVLKPYLKLLEHDGSMSQSAVILFSIFASLSESEMMLKKERFARAKAKMKSENKFIGGKVLYGYKTDSDKHIIIDPITSETVKRIFRLYSSGHYSGRQIATILYQEGILKQAAPKTRETFIVKLLKNKHYLGDDCYPKIISQIEFNKVQKLMSEYLTKPRRKYPDNIYYGHRLLRCFDSKRSLLVRKSDAAYIEPVSGFCININIVDSLLLHCAQESYKFHDSRDAETEESRLLDELNHVNARLSNFNTESEKIQTKFDRLEERFIYGSISQSKLKELESRLKSELQTLTISHNQDLDKQITLTKELQTLKNKLGTPKLKNIYTMCESEQRDMIQDEISGAIIKRTSGQHYQIIIQYSNPLKDCDIFNILPKQHKIYRLDWETESELDYKYIRRFERQKRGSL